MAAYQFVIELIPEKWVESNKERCVDLLFDDADFYALDIAWKHYSLKVELASVLRNILPRGKTWHEDLSVWGDDEHNDIQIWFDHGNIDSIKIRLDLRGDIGSLKEKIIALSKHLRCYFFLPEAKKIIKPDIDLLNNAISGSSSAKFLADPESFLNKKSD